MSNKNENESEEMVRLQGPFVTTSYKTELVERAETKKGGSIGKELEIDREHAKQWLAHLAKSEGLESN